MRSRARLAHLRATLGAAEPPSTSAAPASTASAIDYESYLSATSKLREPNALRELYPLLKIPGTPAHRPALHPPPALALAASVPVILPPSPPPRAAEY